jgi:hypothetical protein
MTAIEKRLEKAVADIFRGVELADQRVELARIRSDPKAHRLTRLMAPGAKLSYRYTAGGTDHTGRTVRFCWSVHRNAAGFFLAWKELRGEKGQGERVGWTAHEKKYAAKAWAERWCAEWKRGSRMTHR